MMSTPLTAEAQPSSPDEDATSPRSPKDSLYYPVIPWCDPRRVVLIAGSTIVFLACVILGIARWAVQIHNRCLFTLNTGNFTQFQRTGDVCDQGIAIQVYLSVALYLVWKCAAAALVGGVMPNYLVLGASGFLSALTSLGGVVATIVTGAIGFQFVGYVLPHILYTSALLILTVAAMSLGRYSKQLADAEEAAEQQQRNGELSAAPPTLPT